MMAKVGSTAKHRSGTGISEHETCVTCTVGPASTPAERNDCPHGLLLPVVAELLKRVVAAVPISDVLNVLQIFVLLQADLVCVDSCVGEGLNAEGRYGAGSADRGRHIGGRRSHVGGGSRHRHGRHSWWSMKSSCSSRFDLSSAAGGAAGRLEAFVNFGKVSGSRSAIRSPTNFCMMFELSAAGLELRVFPATGVPECRSRTA